MNKLCRDCYEKDDCITPCEESKKYTDLDKDVYYEKTKYIPKGVTVTSYRESRLLLSLSNDRSKKFDW